MRGGGADKVENIYPCFEGSRRERLDPLVQRVRDGGADEPPQTRGARGPGPWSRRPQVCVNYKYLL